MQNHDPDARKETMFQLLAEDIKAYGVEAVFGLMSDDTALFATALDTIGVRLYGCRHENQAIAMAEAHAYATGKLAICVIGRGPATANGLHGAVFASRTGSKLLIISGEESTPPVGSAHVGPDYKAFDATGVLNASGLRTFKATSAQSARSVLADAIAAAEGGGLAWLLLPVDVQLAEVDGAVAAVRPEVRKVAWTPKPARPQAVAAAAAVLEKARKPIILAGLGAYKAGARDVLLQLAEKTGALVITSARGKDLFRGSPYDLGILGSLSVSIGRRMVDQADCVLAFGAGLNFLTMSFGHSLPAAPVIHVDRSRERVGQYWYADVGIVGDAKLVAEQLLAAVPERPASAKPFHAPANLELIAAFDPASDFVAANTARTVDPRSLGIELDMLLPKDRNVVCDGGNFLGIVPYIHVPDPGHFKMTNEFASIGLGFGAALGVAKARPEKPTILIVGDGAFMMTMGELETVVREDLPMIIVLMNDCAYGAELHYLRLRQQPVAKSVFPDVDFAPIAEGFGFTGATIRSLDDLRAIAPLLAKPEGPIFLDCKINADVASPFMSEVAQAEGH